MRLLPVVLVFVVALMGPPLAADQAPPAASTLGSPPPIPLVDFGALAGCSASAECAPFTDISCSTTGDPASCSASDRNCSSGSLGQRGYATCGSSTTYCGGRCCGSDGVCEYSYGCGCSDPDCAGRPECPCIQDGNCNLFTCGCSDPDCCSVPKCSIFPACYCVLCSSITDCVTNEDCLCPGSICLANGICLCAG